LSDKSSSSSSSPDAAHGSLFQGFMIGYAYEACRNLYFVQTPRRSAGALKREGGQMLVIEGRAELLQWINTYVNLISELSLQGVGALTENLGQMAKDITPARGRERGEGEEKKAVAEGQREGTMTSRSPVAKDTSKKTFDSSVAAAPTVTTTATAPGALASMSGTVLAPTTSSSSPPPQSPLPLTAHSVPDIESFDLEFDAVLGAIRAKIPYAYYAVLFGEYCSRLRHPREEDSLSRSAKYLDGWLSEMGNALPGGAYDIIHHDLEKYMGQRPERRDERRDDKKKNEGRRWAPPASAAARESRLY
jgi:hypothetical protein